MSDNTGNGPTEAVADYLALIPVHECPQDDTCQYGPGLVMMYAEGKNSIPASTLVVHAMDTREVAAMVVQMVDQIAQNDGEPEGIPPIIRFARGRQLLRNAIDAATPPPQTMGNVEDLLKLLMNGKTDE